MIAGLLAGIATVAAWVWAWVGPWLWWFWAALAVGLDCFMKLCGVAYLFNRAERWWAERGRAEEPGTDCPTTAPQSGAMSKFKPISRGQQRDCNETQSR